MPPIRSIPPPSEPEVPLVERILGALGAASLSALLAALPGAFRTGHAEDGAALVALGLLPAMLLVSVNVLARRGARPFDPKTLLAHLGVTSVILFDAAAILGKFLRRTTHHHVLAGVTFALTIGAVLLATLPLSKRIANALTSGSSLRSLPSIITVVVLALVGWRFTGALLRSSSGALVFDLLALTAASMFGSSVRHERWVRIAIPLALVVAVVGGVRLKKGWLYTDGSELNVSEIQESSRGALTTTASDLGSLH